MEIYAVIMAGGVGSRFWPRSKERKPKQLLRILGDNTMIRDTINRLEGLVDSRNIFIITNKIQKPRLIQQVKDIPQENIIAEPFGKNTAACIGLASVLIEGRSGDSITITLPADHIIKEKDEFQRTLTGAASFVASNEGLVTIGIPPTRPETGYGYIQIDERSVTDQVHKVLTFAEKPNFLTAKSFIDSGDFFWNSGMFIWKVSTILNEIKTHLPELYEGLEILREHRDKENFQDILDHVYGRLKNISIDYGVMEKSKIVFLIKGKFSWSDVGSWEEVYRLSPKNTDDNALNGNIYTEKTTGSYIFSPNKFTAVIGAENLIIINTKNSLLICNRQDAQAVKHVVDYLKMHKLDDYL